MHQAPAAADLIQRAFGLARQSGKTDWWAMTIPVLKNRLLLLTNNTFREADFGATSFRDFLSKISDLVSVEASPPPGFVILKSASHESLGRPAANKSRGQRIRADLWRAVLDYSSGHRYVWDISQQVARPASSDDDAPLLPLLPTVSPADLDEWRAEFVSLHRPPDAELAKRVEEWRDNRLPTAGLPILMQSVWNKYLKHKVEQRLQHWFGSTSIKPPEIIEKGQGSGPSDTQLEALREFVVGCVKTMSKQELLELRISPGTAMRALRTQKTGDSE
jgi:hypothetical protein